jgi:hypothetical protein
MRCWVGVPGPAGPGLERARPRRWSSFAVTSDSLLGSAVKKVMISWSFRAVLDPVCRFAGS